MFHWHIVDSQSFPLQVPGFMELAEKGAYDADSVYTPEDVQSIIDYAGEVCAFVGQAALYSSFSCSVASMFLLRLTFPVTPAWSHLPIPNTSPASPNVLGNTMPPSHHLVSCVLPLSRQSRSLLRSYAPPQRCSLEATSALAATRSTCVAMKTTRRQRSSSKRRA